MEKKEPQTPEPAKKTIGGGTTPKPGHGRMVSNADKIKEKSNQVAEERK